MSCAATTSKATPNLRPNPDQCRSLLRSCWYHQRHAEELYCAASSQKLLDSFAHGWTGALRLRCADCAAVEKEQVQVCLCTSYLNHTYMHACMHSQIYRSILLHISIWLYINPSDFITQKQFKSLPSSRCRFQVHRPISARLGHRQTKL